MACSWAAGEPSSAAELQEQAPGTVRGQGPCAAAWQPGPLAPSPSPKGSGSSSLYTRLFLSWRIKWVSMIIISRVNRKTRGFSVSLSSALKENDK